MSEEATLKNRPHPVPRVLGHVYDGDDIDEYFERFEKHLLSKIRRLESVRAGSTFSPHMELGMIYAYKKVLGLDVSAIEDVARKWKKGVMAKYREQTGVSK